MPPLRTTEPIRVAVRVRPLLAGEGGESSVAVAGGWDVRPGPVPAAVC